LGYAQTFKNALYYDEATEAVKIRQHVAFDETMADVEYAECSPNAKMLQFDPDTTNPDTMDIAASSTHIDLDVHIHPFTTFQKITMSLDVDAPHPLHIEVADCSDLGRAFITKIHRCQVGQRSLRAFRTATTGSYIVEIHGQPVFTGDDVRKLIERLSDSAHPPENVEIMIAPERSTRNNDRLPPIHLRVADLRRVHALQTVSGLGATTAQYHALLDAFDFDPTGDGLQNLLPSIHGVDTDDPYVSFHVCRLQSDGMTEEEKALPCFTRKNLMKLSNWAEWDEAHNRQLDAHHAAGTFGAPVPCPVSCRMDKHRQSRWCSQESQLLGWVYPRRPRTTTVYPDLLVLHRTLLSALVLLACRPH
jgi:hypothetical protein